MSRYRAQLEDAVRAVAVHSGTGYSWFGARVSPLAVSVRRRLTPSMTRDHVLISLQTQLYRDFYCRGAALPTARRDEPASASGDPVFVAALEEANTGSGFWASGWEVRGSDGGMLVVQKDGLELRTRSADVSTDGDPPGDVDHPTGARVRVRLPRAFPALSPGFYLALGDRELRDEGGGVLRWYWNLAPRGAVAFMRECTARLNAAGLPFRLKALNDPRRFPRCDAVVLYVRRSDHRSVSRILGALHPRVADALGLESPALTKRMAPGVGLAEDPGGEESFGMHRCRLLAEGLLRAREEGRTSAEARLETVTRRFMEDGVDPDAPFLEAGSRDVYSLRAATPRRRPVLGVSAGSLSDAASGDAGLPTADRIGRSLVSDAAWHGRRCNWMGARVEVGTRFSSAAAMIERALGPDLYDGAAGVALFLAELSAATGDAETRRTALGGIRQALATVGAVPPSGRLGLYTGWTGIALAAARTGTLLGEDALLDRARKLARRAIAEAPEKRELDLLAGVAGGAVGLVALHGLLNDASLLDPAGELGDELLREADRNGSGLSWRSGGASGSHNLTGLSHGAAGVGWALLELWHATGEARWRDGAEEAFRYERGWFDARAGNWPDLRDAFPSETGPGAPFTSAWCHGAPGIALVRLRSWALLEDETYRHEASVALGTTEKAVDAALRAAGENFSLCHGLAGNADILAEGARVLAWDPAAGESSAGARAALRVAAAGIERYDGATRPWPCGIRGTTPGLMLGLSGIGHFYLRRHDPRIPSVLLPLGEASRGAGNPPVGFRVLA